MNDSQPETGNEQSTNNRQPAAASFTLPFILLAIFAFPPTPASAQEYLISEGGATECSGILYDAGGPGGDYGNNENHTFTICPDQPHSCISFTLDYYFIEPQSEFGPTDLLIFYDGSQPNPGNIIAQIGSFNFPDDGGGGICYQVQAFSGCLTVQFTSDNLLAFEGFRGRWQCANDCAIARPIAVDSMITHQQAIDLITAPGAIPSISSIDCPSMSFGAFQAEDNSGLGLERGLLLASGSLAWAVGPNTDNGENNPFTDNGAPGDPDLDYLAQQSGAGELSENACIVEMDIFAVTNELTFEYIFGSEEYQEYVGREFNDIFAFFISGPGIAGDPNINNQLNIAVLPDGSNTPVEINSVNHLLNWQYYRNNNYGIATQYDGLTSDLMGIKKSLTARADVLPCNTYRLKLAIADRGDAGFDSGVFIAELGGGAPRLAIDYRSGISYLAEDCTAMPGELIVFLPAPSEDTLFYTIEIGGTAERNLDYVLSAPPTVTFLPGETLQSFPLAVLSDLEAEPTETITIRLTNNFGCGGVAYDELTIELFDQLRVEVNGGQDTAYLCQDGSIRLQASGAASYRWSPAALFDDPLATDPIADPDSSQWVFVEGALGPCLAYDSIYLQRTSFTLEVETMGPTALCRGDSVRLRANNDIGGMGLQWTPAAGLDDANSESPLATPTETTTYFAAITFGGCFLRDSVTLDVAVLDFPEVIADTTICQNESVRLAGPIPPGSATRFQWAPSAGLDNAAAAAPLAFPDSSATYQLIATAANGACADTAAVTITVLPAGLADSLQLEGPAGPVCAGDSIRLSAAINGEAPSGSWLWSGTDGSSATGPDVVFQPAETTEYILGYISENGCDTLAAGLRVEVYPPIAVSLEADPPEVAPARQGASVTLSAVANLLPPLDYSWALNGQAVQQGAGLFQYEDTLLSDPSLYTVFVEDPITGCRGSASLSITVAPPLIAVPNTFTPNGDGHNDRFTYLIEGGIRRVLEFRIFNRWGQLVFDAKTSDPNGFPGWDGAFKGRPQPSEVYFFLIRLERYDGGVEARQGEVSLLR